MRTIHLPALKREVSRLGIGSMIFSPQSKALTFELLDAFVSIGGNLVDTAAAYGNGESERAVGMWLAERANRSRIVIMAKACHHADTDINPEGIRSGINGNLERLGTDYLDLFLLHRDNPAVPVEVIVDVLNEEVAAGRIRAFGGSNWSVARLRAANEYAEKRGLMGMAASSPHVCLALSQDPFWGGCTQATDEDLAWYSQTGLIVFAWSSQGRGFFRDGSGPDDPDPDLQRVYHNPPNFERLARARRLARDKGLTATQIALSYVLSLPAPIVALIGPATVQELHQSLAASEITLTQAEMDWLNLKTAEP